MDNVSKIMEKLYESENSSEQDISNKWKKGIQYRIFSALVV